MKCSNDAHIVLLSSDVVASPMIEVFIGGWANQKSAIRLNQSQPDKVKEPTPNIVSMDEYRRFWIRFKHHVIQVGKEGDEEPFLNWENTDDPFTITHFGFATGWGSKGSWIFDDGMFDLFDFYIFYQSLIQFQLFSQKEEKSSSSSSSSSEEEDPEKIRQREYNFIYVFNLVFLLRI